MMKCIRAVTVILTIAILCSVSGVYASWNYAQGMTESVLAVFKFSVFPWTGSDILPEDNQVGENHRTLIDTIINGPGIGLNTSKSYLNKQIDKRKDGGVGWSGGRDTLGSVSVSQGDELNELFALESSNLEFLVHFVNDNTYEIFTTGVDLGERGTIDWLGRNDDPGKPNIALGEYIYPIYKTTVVKNNGTWEAVETALGCAKSDWYDESRRNENATQIPSFDPDTWVEAEMGKTFDTAIWTFVGDSQITIHNSKTSLLYYKMKDANGGVRTVKSYDVGCVIKIYSADQTLIATSTVQNANGVSYVGVSWNASANTLYYISFEGVRNPSFAVS